MSAPPLRRRRIGQRRLTTHRRAGYTEAVRVQAGLADADALERHVVSTLRDARIPPVHGREYYDVGALPVILDVADGWTANHRHSPANRSDRS